MFVGAILTILGLFFLSSAAGILLLVYGLHMLFIGTLLSFFAGAIDFQIFNSVRLFGLIAGAMLIPFVDLPVLLVAIVVATAFFMLSLIFAASIIPFNWQYKYAERNRDFA